MKCNPRDHMDFNFSGATNLERLIFLSEMEEKHFEDIKRAHDGKMVIPYINVPAEGSFSDVKSRTDQIRRMLAIDYTDTQSSTIMSNTMTSMGAKTYIACISESGLEARLTDGALYSRNVTVELKWRSHRGEKARLSQEPEVRGGKLTNENWPKELSHNGEAFFSIERTPNQPLSFTIAYAEDVANIELPAPPKFTLATEAAVYPSSASYYTSNSDNSTGFGPQPRHYDIAPPPGAEFIAGTAKAINVSGFNVHNFEVTEIGRCPSSCTQAYCSDANSPKNAAIYTPGAACW